MEEKRFKEFIAEQLEAKGITIEKISQQTGISERHVTALLDGDIKRLPSAPYVRGYLSKIARLLELNSSSLWKIYSQEFAIATSGSADSLPKNRYALRSFNRKWLVAGVIAFAIIAYVLGNASRLFGQPALQITNPPSETITTDISTITLTGKIQPNDKLLIDNEEVVPNAQGEFTKPYPLQVGLNQIEFVVKRFLGRQLTLTRQVIYQPQ